jgi:hypothetical protein
VCGASSQQHEAILQACASRQAAPGVTAATAAAAAAHQNKTIGRAAWAAGALGPAAAGDVIQQQRLFSVYVHAPPSFAGTLRARRPAARRCSRCFRGHTTCCPQSGLAADRTDPSYCSLCRLPARQPVGGAADPPAHRHRLGRHFSCARHPQPAVGGLQGPAQPAVSVGGGVGGSAPGWDTAGASLHAHVQLN